MNKEEYYKISIGKKLPLRCPILNTCQRRALTIYFFSHKENGNVNWEKILDSRGELSDNYQKQKVEIQGETASIIGPGNNFFYFENTCPEVPLFDDSNRPSCVEQTPCIRGEWDNFRDSKKFHNLEEKHFSECAEFNFWNFKKSKKPRKSISSVIRAKLQQEIHSECPFCANKEVWHFEVHHINQDPSNNDINNLIMICKICHSKITKGEISYESVILTKDALIKV
jgi:hypothetical protein